MRSNSSHMPAANSGLFFQLESFPTRDYLLEPGSLVPFDFRILPSSIEVLNCEVDETEAIEKAKTAVEDLHKTILSDSIDRFLEFSSSFNMDEEAYLHLPFWFMTSIVAVGISC